ncbi:MAG: type II toxin-antitoxin system HicB family antitoxin [Nitrospinae bacterium]|nr:type II toxin-antitoxin system HicB family antitoxin [Nitrospinota bacterium]
MKLVLTEYIEGALAEAVYDKLGDGSYAGRIPPCKGVIAFAGRLRECETALRSVLEDWIILGLKMGHHLPIIKGIDLNRKPHRERVETL